MSNNIDKTYTSLLQDILDNGVKKETRNGGTISVFGRQIRHDMKTGFPLLTTKKMAFKTMVTELLWFLRGDTNIKYLVDNDCHIWDGDAYQGYLKRVGDGLEPATKERFIEMIKNGEESRVDANGWRIGELGPVYGKQWRSWDVPKILTIEKGKIENGIGTEWGSWERNPIDQIANLINDLKTNPDSRRLMVSAWNPADLPHQVLPPCHYGFQVYTREMSVQERQKYDNHFDSLIGEYPDHHITLDKRGVPRRAISLMFNMRSCDTFLGLPFNIASYGLLLMMIADEVNMVSDELIGNLGDTHLYLNHIEQAKEQIGRELTHIERIEKLFETNKDAKSLLSQDSNEPEVISSLLLDELKVPIRTREPYPLPTVHVRDGIFCSSVNDVILENYQSHPTIKAPLSN
jgi:thymidylate synthase